MNIFTRNMNFVNYNGQEMEWVKFNNVIVYEAWKTLTASGVPPLTLQNCKSGNLLDYYVYGNSVQNGTPTPTNPIEIESVGDLVTDTSDTNYGKYKIPVIASGKNLYDISKIQPLNEKVSVSISGDTITVVNNSSYTVNAFNEGYITLPAGTYTISIAEPIERALTIYNYATRSWLANGITVGKTSANFTLNEETTIVPNLGLFANSTISVSNLMIERGNVVTDYEQYHESSVTNIYLDEPLRKIGSYTDYIDFENQKVIRNVGGYEVNGNESIVKFSNSTNYYLDDVLPNARYAPGSTVMCNYYQGVSAGGGSAHGNGYVWLQSVSTYPRCYFGTTYQSVSAFRTYLKDTYNSGTPIKIIYPLSTTVEENIVLPNVALTKGTNTILVNTEIQPDNLYIKYKGK